MKLYFQIIKLLFKKYILGYRNGRVVRDFASKMGIAYIKFAQILATQNYGNLFTEEDRQILSSICDNTNPINYKKIDKIIDNEYNGGVDNIFNYIDPRPIGSASISQVHRAILKNGDEVAIKVKRKDITNTIEKDVKKIRKLIHRYGKFVGFKNYIAGDKALDLYLGWIYEEIDFIHEIENIKTYQKFADTVNGKVDDTTNIVLPKLYEELCTQNIIVMEFIHYKTINQIELNETNKEKISIGINSYIKSSFYALFSEEQLVFHGDPHGGNIYVDNDNNIGFLDMGLLFVISQDDKKLLRKFFLTAYSKNYEKLYEMLVPYGIMNENIKMKFKDEIKKYCEERNNKDVTYYFTDMMNICLYYQFLPPNFLIRMAKAFMCLNGINRFINNSIDAKELLEEQTIEYLINRSLTDCSNIAFNTIKLIPDLFKNVLEHGLTKGIAKEILKTKRINDDINKMYENYQELTYFFKEELK